MGEIFKTPSIISGIANIIEEECLAGCLDNLEDDSENEEKDENKEENKEKAE